MPIMQTVIQGGGTTPTGTINITANDTYDVTDYASAVVAVPTTAPDYYITRTVSNGTLYGADTPMDLHNVTEISAYRLAYALYGASLPNQPTFINTTSLTTISTSYCFNHCCCSSTCITSGLSNVTSISGQNACESMFQQSSCTSTGLTSLQNIGSATYNPAVDCCYSMFWNCTQLTSTDLGNLQTINSLQGSYSSQVYTCKQMFKQCISLTSTDLNSLECIAGGGACEQMFYGCTGLTGIGMDNLEVINGNNATYQMFQSCTGLLTANFTNLKKIVNAACYYMFDGCTSLTTATFPKLNNIPNGNKCLEKAFSKCTSLQNVYFYVLTPISFGNITNQFSEMLTGCSNVTVHFPKQIQSTIGSWTDVLNGFGGTNTTVLFDLGVTVTISIPSGYTVYINGTDVTNEPTYDMYEGDNEIVSISSDGKVGKYNFVATSSTTAFVFDPTQIVYNEFTITANESGATYTASAKSEWVTVVPTIDANNKIYCSAGFTLVVSGTLSGYYADPVPTTSDTSGTITLTFEAVLGYDLIDTTNFTSLITGDTAYASVDGVNNRLLYHYPTSATWTGSVQITLNVPAGTSKIVIKTNAYVSSEANYDYGYLALGTARANPQPTYQNVKAGTIANGVYLFRQSGTVNQMTPINYETTDTTQNVLSVGYAQDSSLQGTNTLYMTPISILYY